MENIIQQIHTDHRHIVKILSILRHELKLLENNSEEANFELISDSLDYLAHYPDEYHHPKEEVIFAYHLQRSDEMRDEIERLMNQHRNLHEATQRINEITTAILQGDVHLRETYINTLAGFIQQQTSHLENEEKAVLPMLEQRLNDQDWINIEQQMPTQADPLFSPWGGNVPQGFAALYDHIMEDSSPR